MWGPRCICVTLVVALIPACCRNAPFPSTCKRRSTCGLRQECAQGSFMAEALLMKHLFAARTVMQFNYFFFGLLMDINCSLEKKKKKSVSCIFCMPCLFCRPVRAEAHSVPQPTSSQLYGFGYVGSADKNEKGVLLCNWCGEGVETCEMEERSNLLHHFPSPFYRIALFLLSLLFILS